MTINILFAAQPARWPGYEASLRKAFETAGLDVHLSMDIPAAEVDYIVYAPNSDLQDFTPYTRAKAVLNLWAGVEAIVGNETLTIPLARMVDPGLTKGMVEWVTGHVLRYHLDMDTDILRSDAQWLPREVPLAQERSVVMLGLGALGAATAEVLVQLGFNVTGWSRSPKAVAGVDCLHGPEGLEEALSRAEIAVLLLPDTPATVLGFYPLDSPGRTGLMALIWSDDPVVCGEDVATIGVDAGLAAFLAPPDLRVLESYRDEWGDLYAGPYAEQIDTSYPGPTLIDLPGASGFPLSGSGWGDGGYPVATLKDASGRVTALYAQFITAEGADWLLPSPCVDSTS